MEIGGITIVHRGGVVDQSYLEATGASLTLGDLITVSPDVVETMLSAALSMGTELIRQVAMRPNPQLNRT